MSKTIQNIDIFNASAALIFSELYKNIPVPTALNYQNLSSQIFKNNETISQEKIISVFINTVTWLKKSGFIWLDSEGELDVYGALLSPKGLEVLSIIPDTSITSETIGNQLTSLPAENAETADLIQIAITAGSKLL